MIEYLQEIQLQYGHIIRPLLIGTMVAIVCGVVGCFIILRRMAFLADAIAHSMLAGVVGGYLLTKILFGSDAPLSAMLIGAMLAGIVTVGLVGLVTKFTRLKEDTAIGIMYTGIFALGAFVISMPAVGALIQIDIYHYIVGSVLAVSDAEIWLLAVVATLVLGGTILFYRSLQLTTFDPVMAASIGIPVLAFEYLLTAFTSLVVVSGVQVVGVILVVALIITPAATAYLLTARLNRMIILAAVLGVAGFWLGFLLAMLAGASPGASVVVVMTLNFGLATLFSPRHGLITNWFTRRQSVSQEILEDVLASVLRSTTQGVTVSMIISNLKKPSGQVRKAVDSLIGKELLVRTEDRLSLTEQGHVEASRIVRAHRIWETYLDRTGTPEKELHPKAHVLEHVSDRATIDYLDDKLGHPIRDPHGSEIPAAQSEGGQELLLSMLRESDQATVLKILPAAHAIGLKIGQLVTLGPRSPDGKTWTLIENQRTHVLSHDQADAVIVRAAISSPTRT